MLLIHRIKVGEPKPVPLGLVKKTGDAVRQWIKPRFPVFQQGMPSKMIGAGGLVRWERLEESFPFSKNQPTAGNPQAGAGGNILLSLGTKQDRRSGQKKG
ncbi:MAG: hypothetical protein GXY54_10200 [Deltaproteobacteria bacterium]|nr:hypothetical protein [Deltaproteobacteria bacterium]